MQNKRGRKYSTKTQAKGLLVLVVTTLVVFGLLESVRAFSVTREDLANSLNAPLPTVLEKVKTKEERFAELWANGYPTEKHERQGYIVEYLSFFSDLEGEEIINLVRIAEYESSAHDPAVTPKTWVLHCQRPNKTYYSVELVGGKQATCGSNTEVHREKSLGIFQILPSTAKRQCKGIDISNVDGQLDCAVNIYKQSGFSAWYNSAKKANLIN